VIRFITQTISFLCVILAAYCGVYNAPVACVEWAASAVLFAAGSVAFGKAQRK
jgi:hypothetical protein